VGVTTAPLASTAEAVAFAVAVGDGDAVPAPAETVAVAVAVGDGDAVPAPEETVAVAVGVGDGDAVPAPEETVAVAVGVGDGDAVPAPEETVAVAVAVGDGDAVAAPENCRTEGLAMTAGAAVAAATATSTVQRQRVMAWKATMVTGARGGPMQGGGHGARCDAAGGRAWSPAVGGVAVLGRARGPISAKSPAPDGRARVGGGVTAGARAGAPPGPPRGHERRAASGARHAAVHLWSLHTRGRAAGNRRVAAALPRSPDPGDARRPRGPPRHTAAGGALMGNPDANARR